VGAGADEEGVRPSTARSHHRLERCEHRPATQIVTYETCYQSNNGGIQKATSRIRFATRNDIADRIAEAGLSVERWLGDWQGAAFDAASREIIPIGRHG
jgi:hypothetical protein